MEMQQLVSEFLASEHGGQAAQALADQGINAKVTPDAWAGAVAALVAAIKEGRPGDGFVVAIELCGAELARHFPPGKLNPNELPDRVVEI